MNQGEKLRRYLAKSHPDAANLSIEETLQAVAEKLSTTYHPVTADDKPRIWGLLDNLVLKKIPVAKWTQYQALPWNLEGNNLEIVTADPFNPELQRELAFLSEKQVHISITNAEDLTDTLQKKGKAETSYNLQNLIKAQSSVTPLSFEDQAQESSVKPDDVTAPLVIRIVDKIFADALDQNTSDIHLTPTANGIDVRLRIDGMLQSLMQVPANIKLPVIARIKLLCGMDISEKRKPQDGRLRLKIAEGSVDLRVATVPSVHGENIVVRVLSNRSTKVQLDDLGLSAELTGQLTRALRGSSKVVLVSGPTGSGKTSTLYAGLTYLADGHRNIVTIEDPVEYRIDGITQMQINQKTGMTFATGLKSVLRQDPDVIMVGEIRDLETASTAMQAAQTGHLVLSTIHTNSAEAAVTRLLDLGVQDFVISNSVSAILAQRLVRRICQCKASSEPVAACDQCQSTGYHGRVGIFSFLEITSEIAELIRNNAGEQKITQLARHNGFKTLWEHGDELVHRGITDADELERVLGPRPTAAKSSTEETPLSESSGKRKLLLVEDDDATRSVLSILFEGEFFDVIEASNGLEGLELAHKHHPDVIVTDLMMPKMGGLEMLKKLRSDKRISATPVLLLTAAASEENELKVLEGGADDFVGKSSDAKIMVARVERLLSR